ncbi:MAG TPA: hypothetical protein DCZ40_00930 [Lachnospiraceae bacterium]|nr:hypothetical protein [Lachnospiraceae bacterium]
MWYINGRVESIVLHRKVGDFFCNENKRMKKTGFRNIPFNNMHYYKGNTKTIKIEKNYRIRNIIEKKVFTVRYLLYEV